MYYFYYLDSLGERHKINYSLNDYYSVMELIWDQGYEDWGDCRGRAWCGTCHVQVQQSEHWNAKDIEERKCLHQLFNSTADSRLSCQILLNENAHQMEIAFRGEE